MSQKIILFEPMVWFKQQFEPNQMTYQGVKSLSLSLRTVWRAEPHQKTNGHPRAKCDWSGIKSIRRRGCVVFIKEPRSDLVSVGTGGVWQPSDYETSMWSGNA